MPFQFTPFLQTLIFFFSSTPLTNASANASSFQFTPLFQTLIGALIGGGAAIAGALITGHFLIKSHEKAEIEKKKLEMFGEVLENVYTPFQEIAEEVIEQKEISAENRDNLRNFFLKNKKLIIMCPGEIKKGMSNLENDLGGDNYAEAIKRIKTIKEEISKLIDKFLLK